jgi:hypothetical protein
VKNAVCLGLLILCGCNFIPGTDAYKIEQAKKQIAQELVDPSSAQFRNVVVGSEKPLVICGEINGKNRMGGYNGFQRFEVSDTGMHQVANDDVTPNGDSEFDVALSENKRLFDMSWEMACKGKVSGR